MKSIFLRALKKRRDETGFSLLELVVAVGVLLVLVVGGLLLSSKLLGSARQAAVEKASDEVYNAAVAYELDDDPATNYYTAERTYMETRRGDSIFVYAYTQPETNSVCAEAFWETTANPKHYAQTGSCYEFIPNMPEPPFENGFEVDDDLWTDPDGVSYGATFTYKNDGIPLAPNSNLRITVGSESPIEISDISGDFTLVSVSDDKKTYVFEATNVGETVTFSARGNNIEPSDSGCIGGSMKFGSENVSLNLDVSGAVLC